MAKVLEAVNGRNGAADPEQQVRKNNQGTGMLQMQPHGHHLHQPHVSHNHGGGCPGSAERVISPAPVFAAPASDIPSQLTHWPVQLHLVNPNSPAYREADLLLAADCVAFSLGSFHNRFLKGKALAIACPKLDHGTETYIEKLTVMIDTAKINTITVMMMEVPCCGGLVQMVRAALARASRKVPVKTIIVGIDGRIIQEEWI